MKTIPSFSIFVMHSHFEGNSMRKYHAPSTHATVACLTCDLLDSGSVQHLCHTVFDLLCTTPLPCNISLELHCAALVAWVTHVGPVSLCAPRTLPLPNGQFESLSISGRHSILGGRSIPGRTLRRGTAVELMAVQRVAGTLHCFCANAFSA